jgi:RNA recognition motif-containing protein
LYISGLARSSNEQDLRRLFEPFGTVKGIRVPTNEGGGCKGFAFVEYEEKVRLYIFFFSK